MKFYRRDMIPFTSVSDKSRDKRDLLRKRKKNEEQNGISRFYAPAVVILGLLTKLYKVNQADFSKQWRKSTRKILNGRISILIY